MTVADHEATRGRAIFVGAAVGVSIASVAVLTFLGMSIAATPFYAQRGISPTVMILTAIPAVLMIGSIYALPGSALLVMTMTKLARRWHLFDHPALWFGAGAVASLPLSWAVHQFDAPNSAYELTWASTGVLVIGGVSAIAAWTARRREKR